MGTTQGKKNKQNSYEAKNNFMRQTQKGHKGPRTKTRTKQKKKKNAANPKGLQGFKNQNSYQAKEEKKCGKPKRVTRVQEPKLLPSKRRKKMRQTQKGHKTALNQVEKKRENPWIVILLVLPGKRAVD